MLHWKHQNGLHRADAVNNITFIITDLKDQGVTLDTYMDGILWFSSFQPTLERAKAEAIGLYRARNN